jgi:alkyl hydroperoxide reductase subunit AhpF
MALMTDEVRQQVAEFLQGLDHPVGAEFHPKDGDPASDAMRQLLDELSALTPKLEVRIHDEAPPLLPPETEGDLESSVTWFTVDGQPTGVRYLGFPGGHEFGTFLEAMAELSLDRPADISEATRTYLTQLTKPIHIQVFVTPT